MEQALKLLNIEFVYTFDLETMEIAQVTIYADHQEYIARQ